MNQLQRYSIILLLFAVFLCFFVLRDSTFNVGITPVILIVFLLTSIGFFCWLFFTTSGKSFALKYENKNFSGSKAQNSLNSIENLTFLALISLSFIFVFFSWWIASITVAIIAMIVYYALTQEGRASIEGVKSANQQLSSTLLSTQISRYQGELTKRKLLKEGEEIKFFQLATYKGGILGHPQPLGEAGCAFVLSNSFVFYDKNISWKLPYKKIVDAKLDFFQVGGVRGMLALGDVARQLQETKNTLVLTYLDARNTERVVKFQIHGALTIPGEAVKATEFLNYLLEFQEYFSNSLDNHKNDAASKLEKLKKLRDDDIITQAEFEAKKRELLDKL